MATWGTWPQSQATAPCRPASASSMSSAASYRATIGAKCLFKTKVGCCTTIEEAVQLASRSLGLTRDQLRKPGLNDRLQGASRKRSRHQFVTRRRGKWVCQLRQRSNGLSVYAWGQAKPSLTACLA